jgi:uncharacterized protein YcfJ
MKQWALLLVASAASGMGMAQEVGRVVSSTPVVQQVAVPRQVCTTEQYEVQQPKSGAGAAMGAIAGGAIGNQIGRGAGQAAATALGLIGGAIVGDRIEGAPPPQLQTAQRCGTQSFYENRTVAYNVVYEYAGRQYSVQMPSDPGPTIELQVSPVGAMAQAPVQAPVQPAMPAPQPNVVYEQQPYAQAPVVVVSPPPYPVYYARPYYPPVSIGLGFGYWGGHRGHHHRHWR